MKFLVILSACVAISTGDSQIRPIGPFSGFPLADVVPASVAALVAHPNGAVTPVETPSVAAARRDHFLAKEAAFAAAGPLLAAPHALPNGPVAAPLPALAPAPVIALYAGPLADTIPASANGLVSHPNGAVTPVETPSVAAARQDHLHAKSSAYAAAAPIIATPNALPAGHVAAPLPAMAPIPAIAPYAGPLADTIPASVNGLVAHPNGAVTPVETPSVAAARQDHLLATGSAYAAAAPILAIPNALCAGLVGPSVGHAPVLPASPGLGSFPAIPGLGGVVPGVGPTGTLVAHPNGAVVPADEPAVAAARGEHLAHFG